MKSTIAITSPIGITVFDKSLKTEFLSLAPNSSTTPTEIINKNTKLAESKNNTMVSVPADITNIKINARIINNKPIT